MSCGCEVPETCGCGIPEVSCSLPETCGCGFPTTCGCGIPDTCGYPVYHSEPHYAPSYEQEYQPVKPAPKSGHDHSAEPAPVTPPDATQTHYTVPQRHYR
ncbi:MAG: hypothetical protein R3C11_08665 [Planctomycetaceae bacterium]